MPRELKVYEHGYVRLVTYTPHNMVGLEDAIRAGDLDAARALIEEHDLSLVNAARASFAKESLHIEPKDEKLVRFLAEAKPVPHSSPARHSHLTLEVNCPLIVCRQWWRHVIGASTTEEGTPWSELSRRYVRGGIEYHLPDQFRLAPDNAKQGSGGPADPATDAWARENFKVACDICVTTYDQLIARGIAPEQARMCLPQGVYTSFRWSPSVQALANFLVQRLDSHAQEEIQTFAQAVYDLAKPIFPLAVSAFGPEVDG